MDYLAEKSVGMLRGFVRLLGYTIELGQAKGGKIPLTLDLAKRAFNSLINEYGRSVPDEFFRPLVEVARAKKIKNDASHQAMLYNLMVLEYMNGSRWCDVHPAVRELSEFQNMLAGEAKIVQIDLKGPVESLRRAVPQELEGRGAEGQEKMAILVFGFEQSIPSKGDAPVLDELNQSRDNFPKSFSGPLLIWLPDYALTRLAREAPDFWGWRSSLSREEKAVRAEALEGLVRDYLQMKRGEREDRALAEVLRRLGEIRIDLNDYPLAIQLFSQSLEISRNFGDKKGVADSLAGLGRVNLFLDDYPKAIEYYEQSLTIDRDIRNRSGEAISSWNLGLEYEKAGDLKRAAEMMQTCVSFERDIGHPDTKKHAARLQAIRAKLKS